VDRVVIALFDTMAANGMALVAVGGYGRSQLGPGSDVDLLLLYEPGRHEEAEAVFAAVLYPLWDAGLRVGHAVRTPAESFEESRRELRTLTALLSARVLGGSEELARSAVEAVAPLLGTSFVDDLRESRIEREARYGRVSEAQAPDLRDAVGGLRDAHVAAWLSGPGEGVSRADDEDLLWRARIALHRVAGGASNALGVDHHRAVAEMLGIADEPGWEAADGLMRSLHEAGGRVAWAADRLFDPSVAPREAQPDDPEAILALFAEMAEHGGMPPDRTFDDLPEVAAWSPGMREAFVRILASGEGGARALEAMAHAGVLEALIPEWREVRGRPQRDPYHRFPVDVHLLRTAAQAAQALYRPGEPFASEAVAQIDDPSPLLLGALLHDIGKVGHGSHVPIGAGLADRILRRMDVSPGDRDTSLFLVREHLLLSDTATRRDLEDEALILEVAARVGDPRRLAMLYVLTVADAMATGPAASTPWRMGLVRELVGKVSRAFDRGEANPDRAAALEEAREAVRDALDGEHPEGVAAFLRSLPPGYLLWVDPEDVPAHLRLAWPAPSWSEIRTHVGPGRTPGTYRLAVAARDRPGLLARIAGALTLSGLSVLQAQAFTTEDGVALDAFEVGPAFEDEVTEERWRRFRTLVRHAMEGRLDVKDRVERLRRHYRPAEEDIPVTVRIDPRASDSFTVVEVGAADRLGLLFDLARAFADLGLDVHVAKVATYGPRVVDAFYVTDDAGQRLDDTGALVRALKDAARGGQAS
jgi:[protein-PII] uridylyltransferase